MTPVPDDDDQTVRITRPMAAPATPIAPPVSRPRLPWIVGGALIAVAGLASAVWVFWPTPPGVVPTPSVVVAPPATPATPAAPAAPATPAAPPSPAAVPLPVPAPPAVPRGPEFAIETATEAQIRANVPADLTIFRFAENRNVLVLDFASLRDQAAMLNRLGAFAEKAGAPHDRVLTDDELDQVIRRGGDTAETFYYGHDYRSSTIARFFALADRDRIRLNPWEETLRRLTQQEGWFTEGTVGALISVPRAGSAAVVTPALRATTLRHELSHGEYFTDPAYVGYTHQFWTTALTEQERAAMQRFLVSEGYDPTLTEVMENETQAYLVFTDNASIFTPSMVGMTEARRAALRANFLRDVPAPWMRQTGWVMPSRH